MTDTHKKQHTSGIKSTIRILDDTIDLDDSSITTLVNDIMDMPLSSKSVVSYMEDTIIDDSESINHLPSSNYGTGMLGLSVYDGVCDGDFGNNDTVTPLNSMEPPPRMSLIHIKLLDKGISYSPTINDVDASIPVKTYRFSGSSDRGNMSIRIHFGDADCDKDPEVELLSMKFCLEIA